VRRDPLDQLGGLLLAEYAKFRTISNQAKLRQGAGTPDGRAGLDVCQVGAEPALHVCSPLLRAHVRSLAAPRHPHMCLHCAECTNHTSDGYATHCQQPDNDMHGMAVPQSASSTLPSFLFSQPVGGREQCTIASAKRRPRRSRPGLMQRHHRLQQSRSTAPPQWLKRTALRGAHLSSRRP